MSCYRSPPRSPTHRPAAILSHPLTTTNCQSLRDPRSTYLPSCSFALCVKITLRVIVPPILPFPPLPLLFTPLATLCSIKGPLSSHQPTPLASPHHIIGSTPLLFPSLPLPGILSPPWPQQQQVACSPANCSKCSRTRTSPGSAADWSITMSLNGRSCL